MRQNGVVITHIKSLVNFERKTECVDQTKNAGSALAGYNGADLGACATCFKTVLFEKFYKIGDIVIRYALNFDCKAGCHGNFGRAEAFGCLGYGFGLCGGYFAVARYHAYVEYVGIAFVAKTTESFDLSYLLGSESDIAHYMILCGDLYCIYFNYNTY